MKRMPLLLRAEPSSYRHFHQAQGSCMLHPGNGGQARLLLINFMPALQAQSRESFHE